MGGTKGFMQPNERGLPPRFIGKGRICLDRLFMGAHLFVKLLSEVASDTRSHNIATVEAQSTDSPRLITYSSYMGVYQLAESRFWFSLRCIATTMASASTFENFPDLLDKPFVLKLAREILHAVRRRAHPQSVYSWVAHVNISCVARPLNSFFRAER